MKRKHWLLVLAALVMSLGVAGVVVSQSSDSDGTAPREEKSPADQGPSFVRSANADVYVLELAKRSLRRVSRSGPEEIATGPAWSSTDRIAYASETAGDVLPRLFVARPDGSGRRLVRTGARSLTGPTWAPDGRRLAVQRLGSGIYILDVRSTAMRRLRGTLERDGAPAWSPDGRSIAFHRQVMATNLELYRIDVTGRGVQRLTNDASQQLSPAWSPDGSRLAFSEQQPNGKWAVATMNLDGSERKVLTDEEISAQDPAWSPDGQKIAFVLQEGERDSIALIDASGGEHKRVTPTSLAVAINPAWSPDGNAIAFAAHRAVQPPPVRPPGS